MSTTTGLGGLVKAHVSTGTCLTCIAASAFFADTLPIIQWLSYLVGFVAGCLAIATYVKAWFKK